MATQREILQLVIQAKDNASKAIKTMRANISKSLGGLKGDFAKLGAAIGAFIGVRAMTGLIRSSIQAAGRLQDLQKVIEATAGSAERYKQLWSWIQTFEAKTPFSLEELTEAAGLLNAYGLEVERWLPLAGELAAVMNKDLAQAINAVGLASGGSTMGLRSFGISAKKVATEAGLPQLDSSAQGVVKTMDALERIILKITKGEAIAGLAQTYSGKLSTIQSRLFIIKAEFGKTFTNVFVENAPQIEKALDDVIVRLRQMDKAGELNELKDSIGELIGKIPALAAKIPEVVTAFANIASTLDQRVKAGTIGWILLGKPGAIIGAAAGPMLGKGVTPEMSTGQQWNQRLDNFGKWMDTLGGRLSEQRLNTPMFGKPPPSAEAMAAWYQTTTTPVPVSLVEDKTKEDKTKDMGGPVREFGGMGFNVTPAFLQNQPGGLGFSGFGAGGGAEFGGAQIPFFGEASQRAKMALQEIEEQAAESFGAARDSFSDASDAAKRSAQAVGEFAASLGYSMSQSFFNTIRATKDFGKAMNAVWNTILDAIIDQISQAFAKMFAKVAVSAIPFFGPLLAPFMQSGGEVWQRASSGYTVYGGTPGRDSVPILAQQGEVVLSTDTHDRLRSFLDNPPVGANYTIYALDSESFEYFLRHRRGAAMIQETLSKGLV